MLQVGLPTYGIERLKRDHIVDMNIGQLQVIANDLCNQIESTLKIYSRLFSLNNLKNSFYLRN